MIHSIKNTSKNTTPRVAEETLRLIASLPAPPGLEDRVLAGVRAAPRATCVRTRVQAWPGSLGPIGVWMRDWTHSSLARTAAAVAIVFVVTGGSWSIYSRVTPPKPDSGPANGIVRPHAVAPGGFSGAGAMRTPQTLNSPMIVHPATTTQQPEKPLAKSTPRKPLHRAKGPRSRPLRPWVK
jgi:hypothetical protein